MRGREGNGGVRCAVEGERGRGVCGRVRRGGCEGGGRRADGCAVNEREGHIRTRVSTEKDENRQGAGVSA